jgi:hypothetical protein
MKKIIWLCLICIGCSAPKTANKLSTVNEEPFDVNFKKGIPAFNATKVDYRRDDKVLFTIDFKEPVVVGVASKPEKWGFFQFPSIGFKANGEIQAKWNMTRDAIEAYGENTFGSSVSKDKGKTWTMQDSTYLTPQIIAPNGDYLDNINPKPIKISTLKLPNPVGEGVENYRKTNFTFYRLSELPESRQGVFFKRLKKGDTEWKLEQAKLTDPDAARYSLSGLLPVVWWGDIHMAKDNSMIAGIYPGFIIKDGKADPRSGAFFYRSTDNGKSWNIQGRINYTDNLTGDPQQGKRMGFTEPAFEILSDGTFLCVLRTTDGAGIGPMFAAFSKDEGKTWTKPEVIAGNGVLPRLLQLGNGVAVLSSGRPGVQLRFSTDPTGMKWSEPFEMLPYQAEASGKELNGATANISDGYTGLLPLDKNRFLLIYSDFAYKTATNEIRKSIKVREVVVKRR